MAARRCSVMCSIDWPTEPVRNISFDVCPSCCEPTEPVQNASPLNDDEAYDLATHFMFDRSYASWDERNPEYRLFPENAEDEDELGIYARADDLLCSALAERARTTASATP